MKLLLIALSLLIIIPLSSVAKGSQDLDSIKNFRSYSTNFASAGLPSDEQIEQVKNQGYQHVVSLLPGDFEAEEFLVTSLDMSFSQIEVVWDKPTLDDFKSFAAIMAAYPKQDKVFLHCQLNWRASTFAYLYRVTQLGTDKKVAKEQMLAVWQPNDNWQQFIDTVLQHYNKSIEH